MAKLMRCGQDCMDPAAGFHTDGCEELGRPPFVSQAVTDAHEEADIDARMAEAYGEPEIDPAVAAKRDVADFGGLTMYAPRGFVLPGTEHMTARQQNYARVCHNLTRAMKFPGGEILTGRALYWLRRALRLQPVVRS